MVRYEPHRLQEEAQRLWRNARRAPWLWALLGGYLLSSMALGALSKKADLHPHEIPVALLAALILGLVAGLLVGRALKRRRLARADELLWRLQMERNTRSLGDLSPEESQWHRRDQLRLVRTEEADRLHADLVSHLGLNARQARSLHDILHTRRQALERLDEETRFIVNNAELRDRRHAIFEDAEDACRDLFTNEQYRRFHQGGAPDGDDDETCQTPAGHRSRERLRRAFEREGAAEIRFERVDARDDDEHSPF